MSYFDRRLAAVLTDRAARMTNAELAALLADPEVSPIGRRVLEAEAAARPGIGAGNQGMTEAAPRREERARPGRTGRYLAEGRASR